VKPSPGTKWVDADEEEESLLLTLDSEPNNEEKLCRSTEILSRLRAAKKPLISVAMIRQTLNEL
jgi:hypothetical protein